MDPLAGNKVEKHQIGKAGEKPVENPQSEHSSVKNANSQAASVTNSAMTEFEEDEFWPLSGKPYFDVILAKSHVKPSYQLCLPAKLHPILPSGVVPVVLTYCGKKWEMVYYAERTYKKFDTNWKTFVIDNDLKVGDACVFELMECSSKILKFRVQILRGDFPPELLERTSGESSNTPIVLDD